MANDCLVTKLKGTVNNPNLPYFDTLEIKFQGLGGTGRSNIGVTFFGGNSPIILDSDTYPYLYDVSGNTHVLPLEQSEQSYIGDLRLPNGYGDATLYVKNKSALKHIKLTGTMWPVQSGFKMDMDFIKAISLKEISIGSSVEFLNKIDVVDMDLSETYLMSCHYAPDLFCSDFKKMSDAGINTSIHTPTKMFLRNVTGSIDEFVAAQRLKYSSGSFQLRVFGDDSNLTYKGTRIAPSHNSQDEITYAITWDATTMTCPQLDN